MVITRALYGLRPNGESWQVMFATTLHDLGYVPTKAGPDAQLRPKIKKMGTITVLYFWYMQMTKFVLIRNLKI